MVYLKIFSHWVLFPLDLHSNSQKLPYNPSGQLHVKEAPTIEQTPLFLHMFCLGQGVGSCILDIITSSSIKLTWFKIKINLVIILVFD
jgi:hypothetical protein